MSFKINPEEKIVETDVLILGSGASGCGAAMAAKTTGAKVLMVDKGKLESSGCLGGGNDHFMAVLNSGSETDTCEALMNFFDTPTSGFTPIMVQEGWANTMPEIIDILQEIGVEFMTNEDGSWMRTVGFGQPGNWWINIKNGVVIKRLLAKKIRGMGVDIMDHIMITKLVRNTDRIAGCLGYDIRTGDFYVFKAKKVVMAFGNVASRGWTNSTRNPYNVWWSPYVIGAQFVLPFQIGAKLINMDLAQVATLLPKGYGAPGMNGINSMGGHELNAHGERFMGKYDPMMENGLRVNQISGTYQEMIEGKGPPFYMDMSHLDKKDTHHLQYVLMPGDKETYLDYCDAKGIDFSMNPLEVEISELSFSGVLWSYDDFETNVKGLYNGCLYDCFSSSMCGGYYAGTQAAKAALEDETFCNVEREVIDSEKNRIFSPARVDDGIGYKEIEHSINQVMDYYMGYRRSNKSMEIALERLNLIDSYLSKLKADNMHELMRANETFILVNMCKIATEASMERRESGRAYFRRTDYPELNPEMDKILVVWEENEEMQFSWGR